MYQDLSLSPEECSPGADGTPPPAETPASRAALEGSPTLDLDPRHVDARSSPEESPPPVVGVPPLGDEAASPLPAIPPAQQRLALVALTAVAHTSALAQGSQAGVQDRRAEETSAPASRSGLLSPLSLGALSETRSAPPQYPSTGSPVRSSLSPPGRRPLSSNVSFANQSSASAPPSSDLRPLSAARCAALRCLTACPRPASALAPAGLRAHGQHSRRR